MSRGESSVLLMIFGCLIPLTEGGKYPALRGVDSIVSAAKEVAHVLVARDLPHCSISSIGLPLQPHGRC